MPEPSTTLTRRAYAKINPYLEVLGRRTDGYHEIETLLVEIDCFDTLTFTRVTESAQFSCSDPTLPAGGDNLVERARQELTAALGRPLPPVAIALDKQIPHGAGLGGGSADAAATLAGLNQLLGLGFSVGELQAIGARIGSDVPFFCTGPAALCAGRGERVTPFTPVSDLLAVLLYPGIVLPTAKVYDACSVTRAAARGRALIDSYQIAIGTSAWSAWPRNRLEPAALSVCEELRDVYARTADITCLARCLTGSGSAVVFYTADIAERARVAHTLTERGLGWVRPVTTRHASGPARSLA